jgi:hypothetical protein
MAATMIVVPRLGWRMMSAAVTASTTMTGRSVARVLCMTDARRASRSATHTSSVSLASSAGWKVSGPAPIHRWAPLTRTPTPGTSTIASRSSEPTSIGVVQRRQRR